MIVNYKHKYLVYSPFKNYSTSLDHFLIQDTVYNVHNRIIGPNPEYNWKSQEYYSPHTAQVPQEFLGDDWRRFLPIRNPYDRCISMWKWHIHKVPEDKTITFHNWLLEYAKQPACRPVVTVYPDWTHLLRCEDIVNELGNADIHLGIPYPPSAKQKEDKLKTFPHVNKSIIKKRKHNFTPYEQDLIYWYHREDFMKGKYSKVP